MPELVNTDASPPFSVRIYSHATTAPAALPSHAMLAALLRWMCWGADPAAWHQAVAACEVAPRMAHLRPRRRCGRGCCPAARCLMLSCTWAPYTRWVLEWGGELEFSCRFWCSAAVKLPGNNAAWQHSDAALNLPHFHALSPTEHGPAGAAARPACAAPAAERAHRAAQGAGQGKLRPLHLQVGRDGWAGWLVLTGESGGSERGRRRGVLQCELGWCER